MLLSSLNRSFSTEVPITYLFESHQPLNLKRFLHFSAQIDWIILDSMHSVYERHNRFIFAELIISDQPLFGEQGIWASFWIISIMSDTRLVLSL